MSVSGSGQDKEDQDQITTQGFYVSTGLGIVVGFLEFAASCNYSMYLEDAHISSSPMI